MDCPSSTPCSVLTSAPHLSTLIGMESLCEAVSTAVAHVRHIVARSAAGSGRRAEDVALMAVVKTRTPGEIHSVLSAGVQLLGENKVQEGLAHMEALEAGARRECQVHFIGRLQSNKAKKAVRAFDSLDGVDSMHLAELLSRLAEEAGITREIMLEVNLGEESQKGGVAPEDTGALAEAVCRLPGLRLTGLMGVCPYASDPEASRSFYRRLNRLFQGVRIGHPHPDDFRWLSMGMSHDYHVAVEEGATLIRVGQALFGPRRPA